ncbi:class I SAM-dependent methyltransferase [Rhodoplanes sp. Z2-YC6860]|uniref:class I SAM-dependent methyltransferase n=1 Tax=Rhodoplanes sp. Z2-YC6860 TaxID=674703 RepID=UPI0018DCA150|nr:class I SAM-dependent methyltransferase [Rhodoplanes sp. Z2-YC6860]
MNFDEYRFNRIIDLTISHGARIGRESSWLDLGCNQGQFLRLLLARVALFAAGSDDWPESQKGSEDNGWAYKQADFAVSLPDFNTQFDVVSAMEVIEHIIDTDKFIELIKGVLKPGGWLALSTPNINSLRNRLLVPFGIYPVGLEFRNVIHHVRLYNPTVLANQLREHGFRDVHLHGVSFLPMGMGGLSTISRRLADLFPSLCNNFIVIARR